MSTRNQNRPTHRAYFVTGEGDQRRWHELGPVWTHKDSEGFTFMPHVLPAAGAPITIRRITSKGDAEVAPHNEEDAA